MLNLLLRGPSVGLILVSLLISAPLLNAESLTVKQAVDLALVNDPQSIQAKAVLRAEGLKSRLDRGELLPTVSLDGNYFWTNRDLESVFFTEGAEEFNSSAVQISLRQPLFRWDMKARLNRAEAQDMRVHARRKRFGNNLMARVLSRYLNVLRAREKLKFANAEQRAIQEQLQVAQNRFEVGLVAVTGVREAQARRDLAQARQIEAEQELAYASDELFASIQRDASVVPNVVPDFSPVPPTPENLDDWQAFAAQHNADTAIATSDLRLAEADIEVARKDMMPRLDLAASYEVADSESRIGSRSDTGRVGVELSVPIFTQGISSAKLKIAVAEMEQAAALLDHQRAKARNDVRRAWRALSASIRRIGALERAAESAKLAWQATKDGNELGDRTTADVLDAQTLMIQAETDARLSRYDYLEDWLSLRAIGGILVLEDLASIDAFLTKK